MPQYLSTDPSAGDPVRGSGPRFDEGRFQSWYHGMARKYDLSPNPDDPLHFYDYRAAFQAGAAPDSTGHWPSKFKREGHPRLVIDGVDTRTGEPVGPQYLSTDATAGEALAPAPPRERTWHDDWEDARRRYFTDPASAFLNYQIGGAKAAGRMAVGLGEMVRKVGGASPEPLGSTAKALGLEPEGTAQELGAAAMDTGAMLLPGTGAAKLPLAARMAATGGMSALIAGAQGNDPVPAGVVGAAMPAAGAVFPKAAAWVAQNPAKILATVGAVEGARRDGIVGAIEGAGAGAALGKVGAAGARRLLGRGQAEPVIAGAVNVAEMTAEQVRARVKDLAKLGRHAEAQNLIDDFRAANAPAAKVASTQAPPPRASGRSQNPLTPQEANKLGGQESGRRTARAIRSMSDDDARAIIEKAKADLPGASASQPVAPSGPVAPIDRGRQAAQAHADMVALAKEAVQKNPGAGWGAKIWIRFKDGKPVGVIPSYEDGHHAQDMASAINRETKKTGEKAVFIRNMWGKASFLSEKLD